MALPGTVGLESPLPTVVRIIDEVNDQRNDSFPVSSSYIHDTTNNSNTTIFQTANNTTNNSNKKDYQDTRSNIMKNHDNEINNRNRIHHSNDSPSNTTSKPPLASKPINSILSSSSSVLPTIDSSSSSSSATTTVPIHGYMGPAPHFGIPATTVPSTGYLQPTVATWFDLWSPASLVSTSPSSPKEIQYRQPYIPFNRFISHSSFSTANDKNSIRCPISLLFEYGKDSSSTTTVSTTDSTVLPEPSDQLLQSILAFTTTHSSSSPSPDTKFSGTSSLSLPNIDIYTADTLFHIIRNYLSAAESRIDESSSSSVSHPTIITSTLPPFTSSRTTNQVDEVDTVTCCGCFPRKVSRTVKPLMVDTNKSNSLPLSSPSDSVVTSPQSSIVVTSSSSTSSSSVLPSSSTGTDTILRLHIHDTPFVKFIESICKGLTTLIDYLIFYHSLPTIHTLIEQLDEGKLPKPPIKLQVSPLSSSTASKHGNHGRHSFTLHNEDDDDEGIDDDTELRNQLDPKLRPFLPSKEQSIYSLYRLLRKIHSRMNTFLDCPVFTEIQRNRSPVQTNKGNDDHHHPRFSLTYDQTKIILQTCTKMLFTITTVLGYVNTFPSVIQEIFTERGKETLPMISKEMNETFEYRYGRQLLQRIFSSVFTTPVTDTRYPECSFLSLSSYRLPNPLLESCTCSHLSNILSKFLSASWKGDDLVATSGTGGGIHPGVAIAFFIVSGWDMDPFLLSPVAYMFQTWCSSSNVNPNSSVLLPLSMVLPLINGASLQRVMQPLLSEAINMARRSMDDNVAVSKLTNVRSSSLPYDHRIAVRPTTLRAKLIVDRFHTLEDIVTCYIYGKTPDQTRASSSLPGSRRSSFSDGVTLPLASITRPSSSASSGNNSVQPLVPLSVTQPLPSVKDTGTARVIHIAYILDKKESPLDIKNNDHTNETVESYEEQLSTKPSLAVKKHTNNPNPDFATPSKIRLTNHDPLLDDDSDDDEEEEDRLSRSRNVKKSNILDSSFTRSLRKSSGVASSGLAIEEGEGHGPRRELYDLISQDMVQTYTRYVSLNAIASLLITPNESNGVILYHFAHPITNSTMIERKIRTLFLNARVRIPKISLPTSRANHDDTSSNHVFEAQIINIRDIALSSESKDTVRFRVYLDTSIPSSSSSSTVTEPYGYEFELSSSLKPLMEVRKDSNDDCLYYLPSVYLSPTGTSTLPLVTKDKYIMIGYMIGLSIFNQVTISIPFPNYVMAALLADDFPDEKDATKPFTLFPSSFYSTVDGLDASKYPLLPYRYPFFLTISDLLSVDKTIIISLQRIFLMSLTDFTEYCENEELDILRLAYQNNALLSTTPYVTNPNPSIVYVKSRYTNLPSYITSMYTVTNSNYLLTLNKIHNGTTERQKVDQQLLAIKHAYITQYLLPELLYYPYYETIHALRSGFRTALGDCGIEILKTLGLSCYQLQTLLFGNFLRDNDTQYRDVKLQDLYRISTDSDLIQYPYYLLMLWCTVETVWSTNLRKNFVQFMTGTRSLPSLSMRGNEILRFTSPYIVHSKYDHQQLLYSLPVAHTCTNSLEIPHYIKSAQIIYTKDEATRYRDQLLLQHKEYRIPLDGMWTTFEQKYTNQSDLLHKDKIDKVYIELGVVLLMVKLHQAIQETEGYGLDDASTR